VVEVLALSNWVRLSGSSEGAESMVAGLVPWVRKLRFMKTGLHLGMRAGNNRVTKEKLSRPMIP
jgi:hypothetical protein